MFHNRVVLVGRLTRDPELRATPDGMSVARFGLAVRRSSRDDSETDFFDVVAFRQLAETVANYTTKGTLVLVDGRLQTRTYTDREGVIRKVVEIIADTVRFLERRASSEPTPTYAPTPPAPTPTSAKPSSAQQPTISAPPPPTDNDDTSEFDDIVLDESEWGDPFR
jgi:single-strand DNA-binding protein